MLSIMTAPRIQPIRGMLLNDPLVTRPFFIICDSELILCSFLIFDYILSYFSYIVNRFWRIFTYFYLLTLCERSYGKSCHKNPQMAVNMHNRATLQEQLDSKNTQKCAKHLQFQTVVAIIDMCISIGRDVDHPYRSIVHKPT